MKEPDIKQEKTFGSYLSKRRAWTAQEIERSLAVGEPRKVTAHDWVKSAIGPRQSLNVEDRRSHKERGKLHRLDIETGEELPPIKYDFKPIGMPDSTGSVTEAEFDAMKAELSEFYQDAIKKKKSDDWAQFKDMGKRTLWNMADKLEKAGF